MSPTHLPLERLFAQLKAAGFRLDTRRQLRLWLALREKGGDYVGRMAELQYLLAPLVATTGVEQKRFYGLWATFVAECEREADTWYQETEPTALIIPPKNHSRRWAWGIGSVLILSIIAAGLIWKYSQPEPDRMYPIIIDKPDFDNQPLREDSTLTLRHGHDKVAELPMRWEIRDAATGQLEHSDTSHQLKWLAKDYGADKWVKLTAEGRLPDSMLVHIHCANPPRIDTVIWPAEPLIQNKKYVFEVKTEPNAKIYWIGADLIALEDGSKNAASGKRIEHTFKANGTFLLTCIVARPGQEADCYQKIQKTFQVGQDKPFLQLAELTYDQPRLLRQLAPWLWLFLLLPLATAAWLFRRWQKKRREKPLQKTPDELAAQYPVHDRAPYFIPYRPQDGRITTPAAFFRMAEVLCRREEDERRQFDAPASVQATVAGGGFPAWRERAQTSPPDYLFLVARASEHDQQGRLFERLTTFLEGQDAPLTVFFHDGDFRHFWHPDQPGGVTADWLSQQYADHQLVLLGDGHGLLNPYDTRRPVLQQSAAVWLRWRKRLLLSPIPVAGWTYPEILLHQHFLLYPADTEGLLDGIEALDALDDYEPEPFALWEAALGRLRHDQNDRYEKWETVADHRAFLRNDPAAFRWLCGLAVTNQPDYALTLAIGQALDVELTHDRLLRLSRIPWLRTNEPVHDLRLQLLALLSPDEEAAARRAVETELEAVREQVRGSFAETDWRVHLAVHRFALDPHDAAHKQLIRELRQLGLLSGTQEAELDWVVQHRIPDAPSDQTLDLDAWLDTPTSKPFWTKELWLALACALLAFALALGGWQYNRTQVEQPREGAAPLAFWQTEREVNEEALRLHNLAVGMGKHLQGMDSYTAWTTRQDSALLADSFFRQAIRLRENYALADSNQLAFRYNLTAQQFNFFLRDSMGAEALVNGTMQDFQALADTKSPLGRTALHGQGLALYYISKNSATLMPLPTRSGTGQAFITHALDSAVAVYRRLLLVTGSTYFDSLRLTMPVNLETLLAADGLINQPKYALYLLVLDAQTRRPIPFPALVALRVRGQRDGRLTYRFPDNTAALRFAATISAPGYPAWSGLLLPRSDGRTDTIFLKKEVAVLVTDRDGDTVPDARDKCPDQPGLVAQEGCPDPTSTDRDGDGVPDAADQCPDERGSREYKGCIPPADPIQRLAVEPPTEALLREALQDFPFDQTGQVKEVEAETLLLRLGTGQPERRQNNAEAFFTGLLPSGYAVTIWVGTYGKTDRYGFRYGNADLSYFPSNDTYFEIIKPAAAAIPLPTMIPIPGGTLTLGCTKEQDKDCEDDEKPSHPVTLSAFAMSKTEVTFAEYDAFCEATKREKPDDRGWGRGQRPVIHVSWLDAIAYCNWLSERQGLTAAYAVVGEKVTLQSSAKGYRLPTEAEWEYAARGGQRTKAAETQQTALNQQTKYAGSDNLDEVAWYAENSNNQTHPVAEKKPNALGLYDMSGNVWEWCSDWYGLAYYSELVKGAQNPTGPTQGSYRVIRGGSWSNDPQGARVAYRYNNGPTNRTHYLGFRLARTF